MADYDAIVIGGGHNGLICAAFLARAGVRTLVLERREILGGACVTEEIQGAQGFQVSTGAAQLGNLRPEIVRDLDIERRFGMTGGHQFHGDVMPSQLFDYRPAPGCDGARTPLDGLYLCGAGAHPSGCVWGAPGERAARAIIADGIGG